jgi:KilA-N domain
MADDNKPVMLVRGVKVTEDEQGYVCLNDMWSAAGSPENKRANEWHRGKRVAGLQSALEARIAEISRRSPKEVAGSTYYVAGRGVKAKTYAHVLLAMDYAEFMEPAIGVEMREVFVRFKKGDVTLALEIMKGITDQAEYDVERVALRQSVRDFNTLAAGVAQGAGVSDFPAYNGAGLLGLYTMTKAQLLKHKGLPPDAHHLDHAGHEELAANQFKATQAIAKIKREGIKGQEAAEAVHNQVAQAVRGTIKELGGVMPEDEPALEHVRKAESRVKAIEKDGARKALPPMPKKKSDAA